MKPKPTKRPSQAKQPTIILSSKDIPNTSDLTRSLTVSSPMGVFVTLEQIEQLGGTRPTSVPFKRLEVTMGEMAFRANGTGTVLSMVPKSAAHIRAFATALLYIANDPFVCGASTLDNVECGP